MQPDRARGRFAAKNARRPICEESREVDVRMSGAWVRTTLTVCAWAAAPLRFAASAHCGPRRRTYDLPVATKGERARVEQQRAAHAGHAPKTSHDSAGKRAAARGRRKDRMPNSASHNEGGRAAHKSPYQFEVSATGRPSRKSSRRGTERVKPDAPMRLTAMNRVASPKQRASRRTGNPN